MATKAATHTPGPWIAETDPDGTTSGAYANHAPSGARMPAFCDGPDHVANSRLIASAPDLAEALSALDAGLREFASSAEDVPREGGRNRLREFAKYARAALRRAGIE